MTVVFSTYHSIDVIHQAQQYGLAEFDLVICDEAHRTTGQTWDGEDESAFVRVHHNTIIKAKKRLYMTATPRIYTSEAKEKQSKNNLSLYSMDDESIYGKNWHVLRFSTAVEQKLLVPYKVIVLTISEKEVDDMLHDYLTKHTDEEDKSISVNDAAKIVGCFKALTKQHLTDLTDDPKLMQRAVAFCQVIGEDSKGQPIKTHKTAARHVAKTFSEVVLEYQCNAREDEEIGFDCYVDYIHGGMGAATKQEKLNWLKAPLEKNACRILTNVRCLSEGVDVPSLDAVLFLTPRNSQVEVVQSVGRVMRKAPGKKRGYIILPVVIPYDKEPHKALNDNKTYKVVWQVLQALRSHDDEFDRFINRIELLGEDPQKMEVVALTDLASRRRKLTSQQREQRQHDSVLKAARKKNTIGKAEQPPKPQQDELDFNYSTGELERAILAKVVQKVGEHDYWEQWAGDIARLAQLHIHRIITIINNPKNEAAISAFNDFSAQLHQHINTSIGNAEIIEMLAQHLITRPVFDALFGDNTFTQNNPISAALQSVTDIFSQEFHLDNEQKSLEDFYNHIRLKTKGITDPSARQKLIITLYDAFFSSAFPRVVQKHGIVYTPVEIVDFILHSVAYLLKTQFDKTFADPDVQVLDPFTGTGTFISRLLSSGLISADKLPSVYNNQLYATEILLLPYYIAAVNIESTFQQCCPEQPYTPFPGILLADTFNIPTKKSDDWVESQAQAILAENNKRRKQQMGSAITVIVGNPPYSVGQKNANDNNQNVSYTELDKRIKDTYVAKTKATNKNALYDSYIRAIRWASDRIDKETGGIIGFVTNAGWLDSAACNGLRKCLTEDFSSLYIFHLRGNARAQGEQRRKEGDNVFDQGSRAPIAISILVRNPQYSDQESGQIFFYDIGNYLTREQKLQKIAELASISGIDKKALWQSLLPDNNQDWLNQRQGGFDQFLPIGDKENKSKPNNNGIFVNFSNGVKTQRDAWCNNPSRKILLTNIGSLVNFYESQRQDFYKLYGELDLKQRLEKADEFLDTDPTKISWTRALKSDLARNYTLIYNQLAAVSTLYRPFTKSWLYYNRRLNEMVYQMPQIFSLPGSTENTGNTNNIEKSQGILFPVSPSTHPGILFKATAKAYYSRSTPNRLICVSGVGASSFSVLMTDCIIDLNALQAGAQCFPLYLYTEKGEKKDGISDKTLTAFRDYYSQQSISKEQIFYYIYAVLHSGDYRTTWQANLLKELPRIPFAKTVADFCVFTKLGKQLGDLHCHFENESIYQEVEIIIHKTGCNTLKDLNTEDFYVEKMKYGQISGPQTGKKIKDLSIIHYNKMITIGNIPLDAYDYVVNGRPAIDWIVGRQGVRTDKASGIVSDSNQYACETMNNPRYPLELLLRIISVALKTREIIKTLPRLES